MTFIIREFRSDRFVAKMPSYEEAFERCIELYLQSDKMRSFYVAGAAAPKGKK